MAPKAEPEEDSSEPEEEESPEICMEQDDVRAKEGQRLTLKCRVGGKPKPKVKWRRGERLLHSHNAKQNHREMHVHVHVGLCFFLVCRRRDTVQYEAAATVGGG